MELDQNEKELLEHCVVEMETESGLDRNAALADMRYAFIEKVVAESVVKCHESREHRRSMRLQSASALAPVCKRSMPRLTSTIM